jgi:hypothetical protein
MRMYHLAEHFHAAVGLTFCCGVQGSVSKSYDIINVDRSALGRVAGAIAKPYGDNGFKGALNFKLTGAA